MKKSALSFALVSMVCFPVSADPPPSKTAAGGVLDVAAVNDSGSAEVQRRRQRNTVASLVERKLLRPLARKEAARSKFSRMRRRPHKRRVRVLESDLRDSKGRAFAAFAIDAQTRSADGQWSEGEWLGCVYSKSKRVYIKRGGAYRSARFLLGKRTKRQPRSICNPV